MGKLAKRAIRKAALGGSIGPAPKSHKITGEFRDPGERPHGQPWLRPWYASPRKIEEAIGTRREDDGPPIIPRVHSIARRADGGSVDELGNDPIELERLRLMAAQQRADQPVSAEEHARRVDALRGGLLDNTPVVGNIRSAGRAWDAAGEFTHAMHYGHKAKRRRAALNLALEMAGVASPLPWGRAAGRAAAEGADTARVFVPAQPSKTADLAREMRLNDVPNREIFKQTNRFFTPSGRMAVEVPDNPMKIRRLDARDGDVTTMGEVIDHPALFGVRPDMREIPVRFGQVSDYKGHPIARSHREGGIEISSGRDEAFYREQFAKLLNYNASTKGGLGGAVLHDVSDQFKAYDDALRIAEDVLRNPKPGDNVAAAAAYIERLRPMRDRLADGLEAQAAIRNIRVNGPSGMEGAMEIARNRNIMEGATRAANRSTSGNLESRLVRMRAHRNIGGPQGLDRYPYEQGIRIGEVGPNWSKTQVIPNRDMDRDAVSRLIDDWHNYGVGNPRKFANGGRASRVGRALRRAASVTVGAVAGVTPGRADALKVSVPAGSYVVPADVVAALGEGNSAAGLAKLGKQFPAKRANGGRAVPIQISDGEFVIGPEAIAALGGGDANYGHDILDRFVLQTRREHINHLANLPGPNT